MGELPTHPELLDYLASRFIESGWSIKAMHRLIMHSSTYQLSSGDVAGAAQTDPDNRLLWRYNRRRLEVEAIRDAMLQVSGRLDRTYGGAPLELETFGLSPEALATNEAYYNNSPRRSVYLPVLRTNVYDFFTLFDFANPDFTTGDRVTTTVPTQALMLLNSPLLAELAAELADDVLQNASFGDDGARLDEIYVRMFSRPPTDAERAATERFLEGFATGRESEQPASGDPQRDAWYALCETLLASSEFLYIN